MDTRRICRTIQHIQNTPRNRIQSTTRKIQKSGNYGLAQFVRRFKAKKVKRNILTKMLLSEVYDITDHMMEARYLPGMEKTLMITWIYADNVAMVFWIEDKRGRAIPEKLTGIIIRNKESATFYRNQFNKLWKQAKPVTIRP
ncbi:MAG: hypothetical protein ACE5FT_01155 [Candidatus Nanoarchaeia archaeon]